MAFWRSLSMPSTSPVEALLDRPDLTLEALLAEEETVQELRSLNSRLINLCARLGRRRRARRAYRAARRRARAPGGVGCARLGHGPLA